MTISFGSVCSGIEAASVAWKPFGWVPAWFSEIEPFPCALLSYRFPDVVNLGDMKLLPEKIFSGRACAPDILCGGTPCQSFSVAGTRKSLEDCRGNLTLTFCEIANAIDSVRNVQGLDPAVVFWENVPGVLSTKDNAFGCFLGELAGSDVALVSPAGRWPDAGYVAGKKRTLAWRVLNAQYFGVPQRRRRVFVVASARKDFDPAKVLFERSCVRGDIKKSKNKEKDSAGFIENSFGNFRESSFAGTVKASGGCLGGGSETLVFDMSHPCDVIRQSKDCFPTLTARMGTGGNGIPCIFDSKVRRLTPTECERLQGFPDDWTRIPYRGKEADSCPDSPRYKAIGNSWAVPVVRWIGQRIAVNLGGKNNKELQKCSDSFMRVTQSAPKSSSSPFKARIEGLMEEKCSRQLR